MAGNPTLFLHCSPLLQKVVASFEAALRREIKAYFVCHPMENFPREVITTGDTNSKGKKKAAGNIVKNAAGNIAKKTNNNNKALKLSTDPQSVAARERRHRISDRFKILQSLVPGGTKMNTVSMLEEAIHYVKFVKTQIWLHQAMMSSMADDTLPPPPPSSYFLSVPPPPQDSVCSSVATPITALPDPPVAPTPSLPLYCFQADESHETMFSTFSINK